MSRNLAQSTGERVEQNPLDGKIFGLLRQDAARLREVNISGYCKGCLSYTHKQYNCKKSPVCKTCGKEGHLAKDCTTADITNDRISIPMRPSPSSNDHPNDHQATPRRPPGFPRIPSSSPEVPLALEALETREAALVNEREAFEEEKRAFAEEKAAFEAVKEEFAGRVKAVEEREAAIEARELEKEIGELEEKRAALQARLREKKRKAGEALEE